MMMTAFVKCLKIVSVAAAIAAGTALLSCSPQAPAQHSHDTDSAAIASLLRQVYHWHDATKDSLRDFDIIVKDSLQAGIDTTLHQHVLQALERTGFFTVAFLKNYDHIARHTDSLLRYSGERYYNEINFTFQDADPWTFFQDDAANYWDSLHITHLRIAADTASLTWRIPPTATGNGYTIKLRREHSGWKVDFMEGFQ